MPKGINSISPISNSSRYNLSIGQNCAPSILIPEPSVYFLKSSGSWLKAILIYARGGSFSPLASCSSTGIMHLTPAESAVTVGK